MVNTHVLDLLVIIVISLVLLGYGIDPLFVMIFATAIISILIKIRNIELDCVGLSKKDIFGSILFQTPFTIIGVFGLVFLVQYRGYEVGAPDIAFISYWVLSVPLQEFIFRGYGQCILRKYFGPLKTAFFASAIFAITHFAHEYANVLMISTFFAGLFWGFAYEKKRNLIGPIVSHAILGTLIFLIL